MCIIATIITKLKTGNRRLAPERGMALIAGFLFCCRKAVQVSLQDEDRRHLVDDFLAFFAADVRRNQRLRGCDR